MDAPSRPPRRPFRISLRTLLIFVTLCGVILGWQLRIVHERKSLRRWLEFRDAIVSFDDGSMPFGTPGIAADDPPNALAWYRRLFGDQSVVDIYLKGNTPLESIARVKRAFPEATVHRRTGGVPLSDEQYGAIKRNIAGLRERQAKLRQQLVQDLTLPEADIQFFVGQPTPTDETLCDLSPAFADRLEDAALLNFSAEVLTTQAAADWLRTAAQLRERFATAHKVPDYRSQIQALHAVALELLRAGVQLEPPHDSTSSSRDYRELLIDYEIVSCQDQPASDSDLSPAERRWHAAALLGQRLCEAAQAALDDEVVTPDALVHSWERRRDARLAAADQKEDGVARRAAWQQFADAVRKRQEIVQPLFDQGEPGGEAERLYLLRDCVATADAALARLDGDETAEVAATERGVENSKLLVEAAKVAFQAEMITAGDYNDAIHRSIDVQQRLAKARSSSVDARAWQQLQADELHRLTMTFANACEGSSWTPYVACHYLLIQLSMPAPTSP